MMDSDFRDAQLDRHSGRIWDAVSERPDGSMRMEDVVTLCLADVKPPRVTFRLANDDEFITVDVLEYENWEGLHLLSVQVYEDAFRERPQRFQIIGSGERWRWVERMGYMDYRVWAVSEMPVMELFWYDSDVGIGQRFLRACEESGVCTLGGLSALGAAAFGRIRGVGAKTAAFAKSVMAAHGVMFR